MPTINLLYLSFPFMYEVMSYVFFAFHPFLLFCSGNTEDSWLQMLTRIPPFFFFPFWSFGFLHENASSLLLYFPPPFWKRWSCVSGLVISLLFSTNLMLDLVSCLYLHLWGNCVISWCLIPCDIRSYIMWLVADGCRKWHQSLEIQLCPLHLLRWIMGFFQTIWPKITRLIILVAP